MANTKIVVVDDDPDLLDAVDKKLTSEGFEVTTAADGNSGLAAISRVRPDLIVLDLMLPDIDGFNICRQVRESSNVLILILTARGEEADQVMGLELGADDYVTKPFSPRALVARIRALLRRRAAISATGLPLPVGTIASHATDAEIWVDSLTEEESGAEATPGSAGIIIALASQGDFWRINQRWHILGEAEVPANEMQLKRNSMGIVAAGHIVEILGDADWIGVIKEVYLYQATTMEEVEEPIAHGHLLTNTCQNAELLQEGHRL